MADVAQHNIETDPDINRALKHLEELTPEQRNTVLAGLRQEAQPVASEAGFGIETQQKVNISDTGGSLPKGLNLGESLSRAKPVSSAELNKMANKEALEILTALLHGDKKIGDFNAAEVTEAVLKASQNPELN